MTPFKRYLLSSSTTFVTVAFSTLAAQLINGPIMWNSTFWFAVLLTVLRAGVKAVFEGIASQHADPVA